jgi:hypothetical protein
MYTVDWTSTHKTGGSQGDDESVSFTGWKRVHAISIPIEASGGCDDDEALVTVGS